MPDETLTTRLAALQRLGTATVHEGLGQRGAMDGAIAPVDPSMRLAGRAFTVESRPSDNLMLHYAITKARPGDVLVVDAKGFLGAAHWGDILAYAAQKAGIAGLVIDGAVRDAQQMVDMHFPVFCRGLSLAGPTKNQPGRIGEPVVVGGCVVRPGDIVVGDRDGVVVVPGDAVEQTIAAAEERERREASIRERLDGGATTVELFKLGDVLRKLGFD